MRSRLIAITVFFYALIACTGALAFEASGDTPRRSFAPEEESFGVSPLVDPGARIFTSKSALISDSVIINFEKRQITFERRDSIGFTLGSNHYEELGEYLQERRARAVEQAWFQNSQFNTSAAAGQSQASEFKLAWEMPVQYPGWAQRVLGNDPPRLTISGSLKIRMAYEDIKRKESSAWQQAQIAAPGFNFEQTNQFNITGSVGRLINLNISANSEDGVAAEDPLKKMKIDYQESKPGELEDEVVQQVSAGYMGFSMPGTQLSGYSESKEGLFGIKITSKFGPLTLTTIASTEQGELQKISISNGKAGAGNTTPVSEDQFVVDRYFFLDTAYIRWYNKKYSFNGGDSKTMPESLWVNAQEFEVWKEIEPNEVESILQNDISRVYRVLKTDSAGPSRGGTGQFLRLRPDRDYKLYPKEGYIRFYDSAQIKYDKRIGIYMRTTGARALDKGGDKALDTAGKEIPSYVWLIKSNQSSNETRAKSPDRFPLMWRNVYTVPGTSADIQGFLLRIFSLPVGKVDTVKYDKNGALLAEAMGIAKGAALYVERQEIFNFETHELIFPPYNTTERGNEPFANPGLGSEIVDTLIYLYGREANTQMQTFKPTFTMEMSGSSKQKRFNLDYGVNDSTVVVRADGVKLQRYTDYAVNTDMGTLELVSPRALNADKIDIEYQRESLFVPEKKVFFGARGEVKLPFISDGSFAGLSILYQGTSINQPVPRINQEPFQKFLLDFNTKLDFKPDWMTKAVNAVPLVKTDALSSAVLEFEVAHSRMDPNTENQAYVDDFESVKQTYEVGGSVRYWYSASPPFSVDSLSWYPRVWDQYWFLPEDTDSANRVARQTIWKPTENERYTGGDYYTSVLRLHVAPAPEAPALRNRYYKAWAGIMTPIPVSLADRKRDQYFELLAKVGRAPAGRGRLRIQMGRLREDMCIAGGTPNGRTDREDTSLIYRTYVDTALDRGLDRLPDSKERWFIPDGTGGWDSLSGASALMDDRWRRDPGKDNYQVYNQNHPGTYRSASRYETNGIYETEDINNDGTVEFTINEQYHEFVIDFNDPACPYIDHTADSNIVDKAWRRYRLPLHERIENASGIRREVNFDSTELDDWHNIRMVRVIWDGFDSTGIASLRPGEENELLLSTMQFVGNQWEPVRDSLGNSKIDVSVIGTRENLYYAETVMPLKESGRIPRQKDERNVLQSEQSLRLNFRNIRPGETHLVQKSYAYQKLDLASYEKLTMELNGMDTTSKDASGVLYDGNAKFFIRFGNDTSTYYEYSRKINGGRWNNFIEIKLRDLSDIKLDSMRIHPDSALDIWNADSTFHIKAPKGRQPSFSNIFWMAVGVVRDRTPGDPALLNTMELWVNELKVVGIKKFNGWSSRLNLTTQWADFMTFSGDLNYTGGDFRTMTDSRISMGDSKLAGNLNLSSGLDKFMPREWGVSMPLGVSLSTSLVRPQLKPNTDVYLTDENGNPDGFMEMVRSVIDNTRSVKDSVTDATHYETRSFSKRFFLNYQKSSTSTNPAVDLLLQRVQTDFAYSMSANASNRGQRAVNDSDFVNYDSTQSYSGGMRYNLTPKDPPSWTRWRPLDSVRGSWLPEKLKSIEMTFLPRNANLNLASASYNTSRSQQFESEAARVQRETRTFTLNHGLTLDFAPISPLMDMSYSLTVNRDYPDTMLSTVGDRYGTTFLDKHIFSTNDVWKDYFILDRERSRSQRFKVSFNPQFVEWLTNSAEYNANYDGSVVKWGNDSRNDYLNAKVNSGVSFNSSLTIGSLLKTDGDSGRIAKAVAALKKGCDFIGFNSVNFTYGMTSDLTNNYLGTPFLDTVGTGPGAFTAYQFGVKDRSFSDVLFGRMDDKTDFGGMRYRLNRDQYDFYKNDNRTVSMNYSVSTGLGITKPIDLSFSSISLKWTKRYALQTDTNYFDTSVTFPDFSVGARTSVLDKVALITKYVQGADLSSNFSYREGTITNSGSAGRAQTMSYDLSPVVAVGGTLKKWPIRFSYQHNMGHEERVQGSDASRTDRSGDNMEMNYDIPAPSQPKKIKVFKWEFPVKGRTAVQMGVTRDNSRTLTRGTVTAKNSSMAVKPNVSYDFTTNVTGRTTYAWSRTTEMGGAITVSNIFGVEAEIRF